jgi:copper chaperone CopZ
MNRTVVFTVSGMTCAHCEMRISKRRQALPGVTSVSASFSRRKVEAVFDEEKASVGRDPRGN